MACRDPAVRRQRDRAALPEADRGTHCTRSLSAVRRRTPRAGAQHVRPLCGEKEQGEPRPRCPAPGGRQAAPRPGEGARLRNASGPAARPPRALPKEHAPGCGKAPATPGRVSCEPCLEKRRAEDRARYARGKAAGKLYGGANPEAKRRSGRTESKRRQKARREAGLCIRCGRHPPVEGGTTCAPCRDKRQAAERQQYDERRAAGLCTRCGGPVLDGLSRCGPCTAIDEASHSPERKNARSRKLYVERRARGLCTACGAPSQGASRCAPVRRTLVSPVRSFPRHPDLGPELHRDRAGDGPGARPVRQSGRRVALPRLRQAGPAGRGNRRRRLAHVAVHGMGVTGREHRSAARRNTYRRPAGVMPQPNTGRSPDERRDPAARSELLFLPGT